MVDGQPIIFPEYFNHNEIRVSTKKATSAGFVYLHKEGEKYVAQPHGESVSLSLKSNPTEDKILIEQALNGYF